MFCVHKEICARRETRQFTRPWHWSCLFCEQQQVESLQESHENNSDAQEYLDYQSSSELGPGRDGGSSLSLGVTSIRVLSTPTASTVAKDPHDLEAIVRLPSKAALAADEASSANIPSNNEADNEPLL